MDKEISAIKFIYKKILKTYPFLTKAEKNIFGEKSKSTFDKFAKNNTTIEEAIRKLLSFLGNRHADIKEWHKPNRDFMRKAKIERMPSFEIKNRILHIKIPSWLVWLGRIDKKLIEFCRENIKKYDAIIIDVRENGGGSSRMAHEFAGIFFKKPVAYGKFIQRKNNKELKVISDNLKPNEKIFIDKPITILISKKCFSSTELFLAPFKISKRAILMGEPTAGGSANPASEIVKISGEKFIIRIPTWRFFIKGKKQPIEKTKIHPDIFYKGKNIEKFAENHLLKIIKQFLDKAIKITKK